MLPKKSSIQTDGTHHKMILRYNSQALPVKLQKTRGAHRVPRLQPNGQYKSEGLHRAYLHLVTLAAILVGVVAYLRFLLIPINGDDLGVVMNIHFLGRRHKPENS